MVELFGVEGGISSAAPLASLFFACFELAGLAGGVDGCFFLSLTLVPLLFDWFERMDLEGEIVACSLPVAPRAVLFFGLLGDMLVIFRRKEQDITVLGHNKEYSFRSIVSVTMWPRANCDVLKMKQT